MSGSFAPVGGTCVVLQRERHHVVKCRTGDATAAAGVRHVREHADHVLRVVGRCHPDERDDRARQCSGELLRAGLAGHQVPGDRRRSLPVACGMPSVTASKQRAQLAPPRPASPPGASPGPWPASPCRRPDRRLDEVRLDPDAVVRDRGVRGRHLQRRHRDAHADRDRARSSNRSTATAAAAGRRTRPAGPRRSTARSPNSCWYLYRFVRAELARHRDRADVRRHRQDARDRDLRAGRVRVVVVELARRPW